MRENMYMNGEGLQYHGAMRGGALHSPLDRWLLLVAVLLVFFGALMVYSSTSVITPVMAKKKVTEFFYFKKHVFTVLLGFIVMFASSRLDSGFLRRQSVPLLVFSFALLMLVFVPGFGVTAGGARRWLALWPSTFQPSELVKLAMVVFLARYVSTKNYNPESFYHFIVPIVIMGVFQIVFLKQPDFGAAMSLGIITLGMLFLAGTRMRYILYLILLSIPVIIKLLDEPYRRTRIISFLDPWKDARGSGFQLVQSFIAFGSGGLTGVGLGKSRQKLDFLPEMHTDFIFSVVGEELGLIIASIVVLLFALLFIRGVQGALKTDDKEFVYHLGFGLSLMIGLQALVNFCVVTGLLPTKGLPLPFISYGGSSLLVNMAAVGILLGLSRPAVKRNETDRLQAEIIRRKKARRIVYGGRL